MKFLREEIVIIFGSILTVVCMAVGFAITEWGFIAACVVWAALILWVEGRSRR